jgi:hypothetical protein
MTSSERSLVGFPGATFLEADFTPHLVSPGFPHRPASGGGAIRVGGGATGLGNGEFPISPNRHAGHVRTDQGDGD